MENKFDKRMTKAQHVSLCNHLTGTMDPEANDCDHTLRRSTAFMRSAGYEDVPGAIEWLKEHGAFCDCEVIFNTIPD